MSERYRHYRPLRGPESVRRMADTPGEVWEFWPEERALRCQWPTAAGATRALENTRVPLAGDNGDLTISRQDFYVLRAVVGAYCHLLTHPCGTEEAVQRLRALRRAEKFGGFDGGDDG